MKFASLDQQYLARRSDLAARMPTPDLWTVADHWPLYAGIGNIGRYIAISDLLRTTLNVPGDVAEFGTWRGATLMLLAKLLRIHDPHGPKVVHCFDTFEGLGAFAEQDGTAVADAGRYRGDLDVIRAFIDLYELGDDIDIHQGLIEEEVPKLLAERPELSFSFVYCDTDLYESTMTILNHVAARVMPGDVIVFDEWNHV